MKKIIILLAGLSFLFYGIDNAIAQEPQLATFQETALVFIDQKISNNVTASITLQSTSNQEIRVPSDLEKKIRENERIVAIIVTNEEQCVLGVVDESCIMINIHRGGIEGGVSKIQDTAREIGDSLIDEINQLFDTNAKFHSSYIHVKDEASVALGTSGVISGRGIVSAVYTMPREDTQSMYEKFSAILLPKIIRDSGGFYNTATSLSTEPNSRITFSIIPLDTTHLFQLKLSLDYPDSASNIVKVSPLEFLKTNELKRSDYFANGFYPINSILQVVILTSEPTSVGNVNANIIPSRIVDGERVPGDITTEGWIFDIKSGEMIDAKYLFGKKFSVSKNRLVFSLSFAGGEIEPIKVPELEPIEDSKIEPIKKSEFDNSLLIIIIIVIVSGAAAAYYLKGYKKGS